MKEAAASKPPIARHIDYGEIVSSPTDIQYESGFLSEAEVTVCVTLFNYERYILEALDSVYDQTLEAVGLVVLDDRSTDLGPLEVERWMRDCGSRFAGVQLLQHHTNKGLGHARNSAVGASKSEFVMVLDADNSLYPRCVERLASSLRNLDFAFAYSILERFGDGVGLMGCLSWEPDTLRKGNYIDAMALIRRSVWERVGGYTPMAVNGWEDYDFWCKCAESGHDGLFVPEILARYRVHGESMLHVETNAADDELRAHMTERRPWLDKLTTTGPGGY